jgi:hypothetical protein
MSGERLFSLRNRWFTVTVGGILGVFGCSWFHMATLGAQRSTVPGRLECDL